MKKILLIAVAFVAVVFASAGSLTESPRELPIEKEVDVLVLGGGSAALSAAVAAAKEGASVFLAAPRPYVGDDVAGTLRIFEGRKLVPISHKRACDEALKAVGVAYMTGLFPSEVLVGDDGAVAGAVLVSKSGRAAVRAGHVLDCTDHAAFARAAGVPFQPFAGGKLAFERTVVTKDEPKADGMTVVERRERRRIKSAYAPTFVDMVSRRTFPDTVVCAQSNFDSHGSTDDPFCMFTWLMPFFVHTLKQNTE